MICSNNSFREHFYGELPRISIERFRRIMRLVSRPKLPVTPTTRTKPRPRTALYSDRPKQGSKIYDHEQENMSSRVRGNNNNSLSEGFADLKKNIKASFVLPLVSLKCTKRGRGRQYLKISTENSLEPSSASRHVPPGCFVHLCRFNF